ncbi:hypothetical protein AOLI_G00016340 [Acnodon oligacanthus]
MNGKDMTTDKDGNVKEDGSWNWPGTRPARALVQTSQSLSTEAEVMFLKVVVPLALLYLAVESSRLVGAPVDTSLADQGARDALRFAVAQYNRASKGLYLSKICRVISVQKQVVSGTNYIFTVEMGRTHCRKDEVKEDCPVPSDPVFASCHKCKFTVWSEFWMKTIKVTENTC